MKKLMTIARQFRDDEDGAAMIEYTILLGVIAAVSIVTIASVGTWVSGQWTSLDTCLKTPTATGC
jgi:pilus assembly protein Flp/PilA